MIYKIYTFQYEANKFLYGLGKGHQQYKFMIVQSLENLEKSGNKVLVRENLEKSGHFTERAKNFIGNNAFSY